MNHDAIVGGIGEINVQSIMHGGNERVVGGSAKSEGRDKILHLKHVPNDTKKMLAIINMARPVVFGNIEYDDGKTDKLKHGPKTIEPDAALISALTERLQLSAENVVNRLAREYKLTEPVYWALTDLIQLLLRRIKNRRENMRSIKVNGDIGGILDRVRNGETYFKIATDRKDWPSNITGVVQELLDILRRDRESQGMWNEPDIKYPEWPKICSKNIDAMAQISKKTYTSIKQYVEAIILREHVMIEHMDAIEMYYIKTARDIKLYTKELSRFIKVKKHTKASESFIVLKT
jgi:hypothetical protein